VPTACRMTSQCNARLQVNAVDSEFTGVQQDDQCRLLGAMSEMVKHDHPLRTFMWGNKRSLWEEPLKAGINVRDRIVEHYKQQYSASRMRLVILSGQSLDILQHWTEELFGEVRWRYLVARVAPV
jgi:secreted Zn-dependent insulinase-like peptidase